MSAQCRAIVGKVNGKQRRCKNRVSGTGNLCFIHQVTKIAYRKGRAS